jgi:ESCRT-I complex subunit VPS28
MNLDEEVRLYTTNAEREKTENLATLYSIIVSLEYLERAYVRDSVTGRECVTAVFSHGRGCPRIISNHPRRLADVEVTATPRHASSYWRSTRV